MSEINFISVSLERDQLLQELRPCGSIPPTNWEDWDQMRIRLPSNTLWAFLSQIRRVSDWIDVHDRKPEKKSHM